jgi:hypothetical protein
MAINAHDFNAKDLAAMALVAAMIEKLDPADEPRWLRRQRLR